MADDNQTSSGALIRASAAGKTPAVSEGSSSGGELVQLLREIPEEDLWLAGLQSEQTRRAYKLDIQHFIKTVGVRSREDLRSVDRAAVLHWREAMKNDDAKSSTIRRRLSALSSLFTHLVKHRVADQNPVREIKRPRVNRRTGKTASFSKKQARTILNAPDVEPFLGRELDEKERRKYLQLLRDRALLSVGLQVGPRRAEIAHLAVKDFHQNQGFWSLRFLLKGGEEHTVSINPQTAQRIQEYLLAAGHADDAEGPLFRPLRGNGKVDGKETRHMHPDMVDRILRKWVKRALGITRGFSAHSMRATFITTALDNGCSLEDVQRDVGHADPSTTKLYDRRGHNPEKSASFFANY